MSRVSEREFTVQVIRLAQLHGWAVAHFRPARTAKGGWRTPVQGDGAGFPDMVLVRAGVILFVELKCPPNRLTALQSGWLGLLQDTGLYARVWSPADWDHIEEVLRG